jgi:hypothetical protein
MNHLFLSSWKEDRESGRTKGKKNDKREIKMTKGKQDDKGELKPASINPAQFSDFPIF